MKNFFVLLFYGWTLTFMILSGCSGKRHLTTAKEPGSAQELTHDLFDTSGVHSGLIMVEASRGLTDNNPLIEYHSSSLFTPASNTKILTLYAALKYLPETLSGIRWIEDNGTLYLKGTGDPGFLDPRFSSDSLIAFLKGYDRIVVVSDWSGDKRWGPGWSWEDYPYYYAAQRSPLPLYGNVVRAWCREGSWNMEPPVFIRNQVNHPDDLPVKRNELSNIFQLNKAGCTQDTLKLPFIWTPEVAIRLLRDTLQRQVSWQRKPPVQVLQNWKNTPGSNRDTLLRAMMYDSDNFIAEQMQWNISSALWDTLNTSMVIDSLMETDFVDWKDKIRWVDGSGLSVYNKFSPRFLVQVLHRLYNSMPRDLLFRYFAAGGTRGTIAFWYGNEDGPPYVYAKTGTLSGVHCLSGYLLADSGKVFIFSFMHNNFLGSSRQYKEKMQELLKWIKLNH